MIKYIGSKRLLVPALREIVRVVPGVSSVVDLFSGTSRVGHALKAAGYRVLANDHNAYAAVLARCYVQADREDLYGDVEKLVRELNALPGRPGYFTETFCVRSRYFRPENGERIDAIREVIAEKSLDPEIEAVLLVSLMEAADRVDSTTGLQMAYLKEWAPRAYNALSLRVPDLLPRAHAGKGSALQLDAFDAAAVLDADLTYLDPPYNQHKYLGNYHIWESLVLWDKPDVYGTACKRVDCKRRSSVFNSRPQFEEAFAELLSILQSRWVLVSFNNEGYLTRDKMCALLAERGHVHVVETDYKRYVGAKIGIYNPSGDKVGTVAHVDNKEFIFLVGPERLDVPSLWGSQSAGSVLMRATAESSS